MGWDQRSKSRIPTVIYCMLVLHVFISSLPLTSKFLYLDNKYSEGLTFIPCHQTLGSMPCEWGKRSNYRTP